MEYDIIPDRSSKNAKKALELAVERGFSAEDVRTFRGGYYVPLNVEDAPEPKTEEEGKSEEDESKADESKAEEKSEESKAEETKPAPKTARKRTAKKE